MPPIHLTAAVGRGSAKTSAMRTMQFVLLFLFCINVFWFGLYVYHQRAPIYRQGDSAAHGMGTLAEKAPRHHHSGSPHDHDDRPVELDHGLDTVISPRGDNAAYDAVSLDEVSFIKGESGKLSRVTGPANALDKELFFLLAGRMDGKDIQKVELPEALVNRQRHQEAEYAENHPRSRFLRRRNAIVSEGDRDAAGGGGAAEPPSNDTASFMDKLFEDIASSVTRMEQRFRVVLVVIAHRSGAPLNLWEVVRSYQDECSWPVARVPGSPNDHSGGGVENTGRPTGAQHHSSRTNSPIEFAHHHKRKALAPDDELIAAAEKVMSEKDRPTVRRKLLQRSDSDRFSTTPAVVCLVSLVLPADYSSSAAEFYRKIFEHDDSVHVVHANALLKDGIGRLQQAGFDSGESHFSTLLGGRADIDYVLLTSSQFSPHEVSVKQPDVEDASSSGSLPSWRPPATTTSSAPASWMVRLVEQYELSSDRIETNARRIRGGAARRGPIMGCSLIIPKYEDDGDENVIESYPSSHVILDHGSQFLLGNGDGGKAINHLYAVRRHMGIPTVDERFEGGLRSIDVSAMSSGIPHFNASLPRGVDAVHIVSPYCAFMAERMFRHFDGVGEYPLSPTIQVYSILDAIEASVINVNEDSRRVAAVIDHEGILFDIFLLRLRHMEALRSSVKFSEVMSGTPEFKRAVAFSIRYFEECVRYFDQHLAGRMGASYFKLARKLPTNEIYDRLPNLARSIERRHSSVLDAVTSTRTRIATATLWLSHAATAVERFILRKASRQTANHVEGMTVYPEEAAMWDLCMRARDEQQVAVVVTSLAVELNFRRRASSATHAPIGNAAVWGVGRRRTIDTRGEDVGVPPLREPLTSSENHSPSRPLNPVFALVTSRTTIPVSLPLPALFREKWQDSIVTNGYHPSFREKPALEVVWYTHCCHCCGFTNEIQSLVYPLQHLINVHLTAGLECFCSNASRSLQDSIQRMFTRPQNMRRHHDDDIIVWLSHTNPTLYHLVMDIGATKVDYFVGRSMYEFSKIDSRHIQLANERADEIWVPSKFVYHSYVSSGAVKSKLHLIPEAIDTHLFNPRTAGKFHFPLPRERFFYRCNHNVAEMHKGNPFVFLSDFKWEPRKGWDVLFESYIRAFNRSDNVALYVMTHIWFPGGPETYGWAHNLTWLFEDLERYLTTQTTIFDEGRSADDFPSFCIVSQDMAIADVASVYNSVNALVYTTRGEGWGLPAMQAMSMGLPVIATNWGGVTEFMKPFNSFLVQVDAVEEIPRDSVYGWSLGTKWAVPSRKAASAMMQYVVRNPRHARVVGRRARRHIVKYFSEEAVANVLKRRLDEIRSIVLRRRAKW
jgi:glycosyltransferase involved in cell wall biosynthesis